MTRALLRLTCAGALLAVAAWGCRRDAGPADDGRTPVWLDISPAVGDPPRDPGDALALLQAYGSGRLSVRGVSITFGNVPLVRGYAAAQALFDHLDTGLLRPWRGASSPEERAAPTEATELLLGALGKQRVTILALGPLTTVASVLLRHPAAAAHIERVVLVGGQPAGAGHGEGRNDRDQAPTHALADPESLQVVLDSSAALTLIAPGRSTGFTLGAADLDHLEKGRGPVRLVLPGARAWLQAVSASGGEPSFAAPAMLAVDATAHPGRVRCEVATAALVTRTGRAAALAISSAPAAAGRRVTWCHTADADARRRILGDVVRLPAIR